MSKILNVSFEWLATGHGNQYPQRNDNEIKDEHLDSEINRLIPRLTIRRKKAVLEIIREMH